MKTYFLCLAMCKVTNSTRYFKQFVLESLASFTELNYENYSWYQLYNRHQLSTAFLCE
jgi:hypothetical protein